MTTMSEGRWVGGLWETTCTQCGAVLQMRAPEVEPKCLFCPFDALVAKARVRAEERAAAEERRELVDRVFARGQSRERAEVAAWLRLRALAYASPEVRAEIEQLARRLERGEHKEAA